MEIYFYKEKIDKVIENYNKLRKKMMFLRVSLAILVLILLITTLIIFIKESSAIDYFGPIAFCFVFLITIFYVIFYAYKKNKYFYEEIDKLIISILRLETDYDVMKKYDKKGYTAKIYDTRIVSNGDSITLKSALSYETGNIKSDIYSLTASRSNSNSSITVIDGIVVSFDLKTNLDFQIRTDKIAPRGMKKLKTLSTKEYSVYSEQSLDTKNGVNEKLVKQIEWLKGKFDCRNVGIDYNRDCVSFYVSKKEILSFPKKLTTSSIEEMCKKYLECIENTKSFFLEVEKNELERLENYF